MRKGFMQHLCLVAFYAMLAATSSLSAPLTNDAKRVDVGSRYLYLTCKGKGSPTVIFESGFRNNSDVWTISNLDKVAIFPAVAKFTRVCAYDRPGTIGWDVNKLSRSDPVSMPRAAQAIVNDLHKLLQVANEPGPYVMVGHSLGGLLVRLYASTYPKEVVGMVLVDALPDQLRNDLGKKNWEAYKPLAEQPPEVLKGYKDLEWVDFDEVTTAMIEAQKTSPLTPMPLVVITHGKEFDIPTNAGISRKTLEVGWQSSQRKLAKLVPHAKLIIAEKSEHYVQIFEPELIIGAIQETVDAVRAQGQ